MYVRQVPYQRSYIPTLGMVWKTYPPGRFPCPGSMQQLIIRKSMRQKDFVKTKGTALSTLCKTGDGICKNKLAVCGLMEQSNTQC